MLKRLLVVLIAVLPLAAQAEQIDARLFKYDVCGFYAVMHINGVDNTIDDATNNLNKLKAAYGNAHKGFQIRYQLGYNASLSLYQDVAESMNQTLALLPGTSSTSTYEEWYNAFYKAIFPADWPADQMAKISAKLATIFNVRKPDSYYQYELQYILGGMQAASFTGSAAKLLMVGHSQGSIYANIIYRSLTTSYGMKPHQIGLMSIAAFTEPPLPGTGSTWVTNANDNPVNMGRFAWPGIFKSTVTIPNTESAFYIWRGHNLVNKYLAYSTSKNQITSKMKTVLDGLNKGAPGGGPNYGTYESNFSKVVWGTNAATGIPYMQYTEGPGSNPITTVSPATKEQARLKAIELAERCAPWVISVNVMYFKLGQPLPAGVYAGGCWTTQYSNFQAWSIYSSDGPTPAGFALWDDWYQQPAWYGYAGYTCQ